MLHLIPPVLHRRLYKIAYWLRAAWWRLAKPTVRGCRVIALDDAGRVLLIRQSYGPRHWLAPGGSIEAGEDPVDTAHRELREETGCTLRDARKVAQVLERPMGAFNEVHVVVGRASGGVSPDRREVDEVGWFALDALPLDTGPRIAAGLAHWVAAYRNES